MAAFTRDLARVVRRPAFFKVPAFALRLAVGQGAEVVLTGQNAVPRALLATAFSFRYPVLLDALAATLGKPTPS